ILTAGEPIVLKNKNDRGWGKVLQRSQITKINTQLSTFLTIIRSILFFDTHFFNCYHLISQ
ncbi:hypothetical protein DEM91_12710, partial [Prevotella sp. TCVGH]|nr:hypothetical protein [Prevotella sp. TCVGH]